MCLLPYLKREEDKRLQRGAYEYSGWLEAHSLNLAHLTSRFVWPIQLTLFHIPLLKVLIRKYFSKGKCDLTKFLVVLSGKTKILTL
jgi:hypothetical protein